MVIRKTSNAACHEYRAGLFSNKETNKTDNLSYLNQNQDDADSEMAINISHSRFNTRVQTIQVIKETHHKHNKTMSQVLNRVVSQQGIASGDSV